MLKAPNSYISWVQEPLTSIASKSNAVAPTILNTPASTGGPSPTSTTKGGKSRQVGAIAGGAVGGMAFLAIIIGALVIWIRRRRAVSANDQRQGTAEPSRFSQWRKPELAADNSTQRTELDSTSVDPHRIYEMEG